MRLYLILFCSLLAFSCTENTTISSEQTDQPAETFSIHRGVNISHWLSQSGRRGEERRSYFTEDDVIFLAEAGFDHLRIPIDEEQLWDEAGNKEAEAFELLHNGLGWCQKHDLRAIVDLHILRSHHFNEAEKPLWTDSTAQERFFQCWRELSAELHTYPTNEVAYELMNEPVADDPEDWNQLVANAIDVVREREPERKILVGSNRWQSTETFDVLRLPEGDTNLIVSFHFYEPFLLTHHQTSWTDIGEYDGPVQYPGKIISDEDFANIEDAELRENLSWGRKVFTKDSLEQRILKPVRFAEERDLPVYCGEWGCYKAVPNEILLRWYTDVRSIFEQHDIAWTIWDYKGGFGIKTPEGEVYDDLLGVLTAE